MTTADTNDLLLELTPGERQSATWQKLLRYANAHLANCRAKNDGELGEIATADMRGRIAVYKAFVALDQNRVPLDT